MAPKKAHQVGQPSIADLLKLKAEVVASGRSAAKSSAMASSTRAKSFSGGADASEPTRWSTRLAAQRGQETREGIIKVTSTAQAPSLPNVGQGAEGEAAAAPKRKYSALLSAALAGSSGQQSSAAQVDARRKGVHRALAKATSDEDVVASTHTVTNSDGTGVMLNDFASEMVRKLSGQAMSRFVKNMGHLPGRVRLGSACSGTDVCFAAISTPFEIIGNEHMHSTELESAFVCEKIP